ncbi:hypothetical protein BN1079_01172 [Pseudomonas saudiphocaensis]|uniref:Uncharacterized protein n=1 Tax=Pseudomonas saudiphocaensis TaxID=1499686 RepID=A0A078LU69_9PSED|nr:hypothetical protein BN1079_01172 [Pseudomonas saudiphocaensis]
MPANDFGPDHGLFAGGQPPSGVTVDVKNDIHPTRLDQQLHGHGPFPQKAIGPNRRRTAAPHR